jgi:DNA (cytosine-5)-methyltransferase 1
MGPVIERTFVDLFCGAGGISEGFRQAGFRPLAGVDHDPDTIATYRANFPEAMTICGDIRDPEIKAQVLEIAAGVDVLAGGPPCQAFSQVRNHVRLMDDPRNSLYREFIKVARIVEPKVLVMENVPGMAEMGVVKQVVEDMSSRGRYVVRPNVVNAVDFGVPQTRRRIVFLAFHADLGMEPPVLACPSVMDAVGLSRRNGVGVRYELVGDSEAAERLCDPWNDSLVSVEQAIGDLIKLRVGEPRKDECRLSALPAPSSSYQKAMRDGLDKTVSNIGIPRIRQDTVLRLRAIPPGGNHLDLPENLTDRYIVGGKWGQDNGSGKLSRRHFYAYRRLHPGIWSWTLNTKADSVYHWSVERALSVREFARLQSFPDRFVVTTDERKGPLEGRIDGGPGHSRYRQIGNAVPPLLARRVAEKVEGLLS